MKRLIDPLVGDNSSRKADASKTREDRMKEGAGGGASATTSPSTRSCAPTLKPGARRSMSTSAIRSASRT